MKTVVKAVELKAALSSLSSAIDTTDLKKEQTFATFEFYQEENQLDLKFSSRGLQFSYQFQEHLTTASKSSRKQVDWKTLLGLKFPEEQVHLDLSEPGVLNFQCGKFRGELPLAVEGSLPELPVKTIPLTHTFSVTKFLAGLHFHQYGVHHNPIEAEKRPLRLVLARESYAYSYDKQISAKSRVLDLTADEPLAAEILPKTFKMILSSFPTTKKKDETFDIGLTKELCRLRFQNINIVMRNLAKDHSVDIEKICQKAAGYPGTQLVLPAIVLRPLLDSFDALVSKAAKEDNPLLVFRTKEGKTVVRIETSKVKNVEYELDVPAVELKESVVLGYRYFSELTENLYNRHDEIVLEWWDRGDESAPSKGRVLKLSSASDCYFMGRLLRK